MHKVIHELSSSWRVRRLYTCYLDLLRVLLLRLLFARDNSLVIGISNPPSIAMLHSAPRAAATHRRPAVAASMSSSAGQRAPSSASIFSTTFSAANAGRGTVYPTPTSSSVCGVRVLAATHLAVMVYALHAGSCLNIRTCLSFFRLLLSFCRCARSSAVCAVLVPRVLEIARSHVSGRADESAFCPNLVYRVYSSTNCTKQTPSGSSSRVAMIACNNACAQPQRRTKARPTVRQTTSR